MEKGQFYSNEYQNKIQFWFRIIVLIIVLFLVVYIVVNIQSVKLLDNNPCKVCMKKLGGYCFTHLSTNFG